MQKGKMIISSITPGGPVPKRNAQEISDGLEKAFLGEMLKYAGPQPMQGAFGGGIGEEQFSSMMTETYADALAKRLDLGLAGRIGGAA
ncbi:rod-binding protein [Paracoccus limosus]|uniref:rod-binding protein n=1 Tax=Paracoccus limosus TaxID=913252 RepID=UPI001FE40558|nr:rod-binding protein [Paracoccus limosus]